MNKELSILIKLAIEQLEQYDASCSCNIIKSCDDCEDHLKRREIIDSLLNEINQQ